MSAARPVPGPALRAVVRWAWRMFRREWRQQVLVVIILAAAVAVSVAGATIVVNATTASDAEFGLATGRATADAPDVDVAARLIDAARRRFGAVDVIGRTEVALPGSAEPVELRSQSPRGRFGSPLLALVEGRFPRDGETALTRRVASLLDAGVGDDVELGHRRRRVVGIVENPTDLHDEFALVDPATPAGTSVTVLFDRSGRGSGDEPDLAFPIEARGNGGSVGTTVLVAATLALALVGLIAASGFVVIAHRRQRQLGMLAVVGATERHLRLVVVSNGTLVGLAGAAVGGVVGIGGWVLAAGAAEQAANHRIDRWDLPWHLVVPVLLLAVVVSTAAAWWPARMAGRLQPMAALSGRPAAPTPVHRSAIAAVVVLAGGMTALYLAFPPSRSVRAPLVIGGLLAVIVGTVVVAPATIRAVAAVAPRLPLAPRLALRDLARYQSRAAAALAAITLGVGISASLLGVATASKYRSDEGNLSDRQLLIRRGDLRTDLDPSLSQDQRAALDLAAKRVASAVRGASVQAFDVAMARDGRSVGVLEPIAEVSTAEVGSFEWITYPVVATPEVLRWAGINESDVRPDADLLTRETGSVGLLDQTKRRGPGTDLATSVQRVHLPRYESAPTALVTPHAMTASGWVAARASWLVESDAPLTARQIARAREAAADVGMTIEVRSQQDDLAAIRAASTVAGSILALAIVAMAIGLLRSESAADLRTLEATGAPSTTRRAITATTAGTLAGLGVLLGTGAAYLATYAAYRSEPGRLFPPPLFDLLVLVVAVPLVAAAGGWLLGGRERRPSAGAR